MFHLAGCGGSKKSAPIWPSTLYPSFFLYIRSKLIFFRYCDIENLLESKSLTLWSTFALFEPKVRRRLMPFPDCWDNSSLSEWMIFGTWAFDFSVEILKGLSLEKPEVTGIVNCSSETSVCDPQSVPISRRSKFWQRPSKAVTEYCETSNSTMKLAEIRLDHLSPLKIA